MRYGILCAALLATANCGAADTPVNPPLIDAHFHVMPYMDMAVLQQAMDRHGIRAAGGAGAAGDPQLNEQAARVIGTRFIRSTGQSQWIGLKMRAGVGALEDAESSGFKQALAAMEADLRDNGARVIGEIHVNSQNSAANPRVNIRIRADAPTLQAMLALAGKYKRALNVHAEFAGDTARELVSLAQSNRDARLVLSHCGVVASAADIRAAFEQNPNISCDLSYRSPPQLKPRILNRMIFDAARLDADWKKLIEDYPDRFVVGIDDVFSWDEYEQTANNIRSGLLANLKPETAEKLAYRNAQAMFGLE